MNKYKIKDLSIVSVIALTIIRCILGIYFRIFYFMRVEGKKNVPKTGGVILAVNHASFYDPPICGTYSPRLCRYLARETLFKFPIFGWCIYMWGALPVKRGAADKSAITTSIEILKANQVMIIFPEGTRTKDGKIGELRPGVLSLAAHTSAAVVPVTLYNMYKIWPKSRKLPRFFVPAKVKFHPPIFVHKMKDKAEEKKYHEDILKKLHDIFKDAEI